MKTKVMHLLRTTEYSGAENVVCQIIKIFNNQKYDMFYSSPKGKIETTLEQKNIPYIPMEGFDRRSLKRNVKKYKINIVHAHDPGACVLAAFSNIKTPIIAHVHGNHDNMKVCSLKALLFLVASIRFKKIIWVSDSAFKDYYFQKFVKKKSVVLVNVIDAEEVKKKAGKSERIEFDCIYLGRLSPEKNPLRAIRILDSVIKKNVNYKCVIVGDGPLRAKCQKKVKELNLENNIIFKGFIENPYPILKKSSVLLFSSNYEGTPMSALEAMCLGKPIVSTSTDGLVKLIQLNETGYFSDDEKKLSGALNELYKNPQKLKKMSKKTEERFRKINNTENYKKVINEIYMNTL